MKVGDIVKLEITSEVILNLGRAGVPPRHCPKFINVDLQVTYVDPAGEWARVRPPTYDTSFFFPTKWFAQS